MPKQSKRQVFNLIVTGWRTCLFDKLTEKKFINPCGHNVTQILDGLIHRFAQIAKVRQNHRRTAADGCGTMNQDFPLTTTEVNEITCTLNL